jgi:hypothetical protein
MGGKPGTSDFKIANKEKDILDGIPFCLDIQNTKNNQGWGAVKGVLPMRLNP